MSRCEALDTEIFRHVVFLTGVALDQGNRPEDVPASSKISAVRYSRVAEVYTTVIANIVLRALSQYLTNGMIRCLH